MKLGVMEFSRHLTQRTQIFFTKDTRIQKTNCVLCGFFVPIVFRFIGELFHVERRFLAINHGEQHK